MRGNKANIGSLSSMASKVRQEKKNNAAAKAKAPLARAREANNSFKSAEFVNDSSSDSDTSSDGSSDSGSEDDLDAARAKFLASKAAKQNKVAETKASAAKPVASTPAKPATEESIPPSAQKAAAKKDSESSSESETSDSSSDAASSKPKASAKKEEKKILSNSSSSGDSSSESEDEAAAKTKPANGKGPVDSSSDGSDSSSDDEDTPKSNVGAAVNGAAKKAAADPQQSSSEESDSGSESDDEGDGGLAVAGIAGKNGAKEPDSQLSKAPWLNSSDFMLRKASSQNPGKEVADFLSNGNLEGKQVWYFTAPASLPITVLKDMEIDLAKAMKGESLFNHKGDNYGLDLEAYATTTQIQLLIPSHGGDKYASLNHSIDSTVHLRRMAKFGPGGEVHATATDDYVPVPKLIREQPEGLRVRYTPIGVPTPTLPNVASTKQTSTNASSSQIETKNHEQSTSSSESESESESESGSDVKMNAPPASNPLPSQSKSAKAGATNGDRKRKHSGDQDQAAKRPRAEETVKTSNAKKNVPAQISSSAVEPDETPSKKPSTKTRESKTKKKLENTTKPSTITSNITKQTPIPLPKYPGMKH